MVGKGLIEDSDHGASEKAPCKELKEDHHQGMVNRGITCSYVELEEVDDHNDHLSYPIQSW